MKLSFFIARRYLFAQKTRLVNWISRISVVSIIVGTAALFIVLSVFNGLSGLVANLYGSFDPDLKIQAKQGKYFFADEVDLSQLQAIDGVLYCIPTIEESVLLRYGDNQQIAVIKGVDDDFKHIVEPLLTDGIYLLSAQMDAKHPAYTRATTVLAQGVHDNLEINLHSPSPVEFYAPNRGKTINVLSDNAFQRAYALPVGCFSSIQEYNIKYIITHLQFARELLDAEDEISAIEIILSDKSNPQTVQKTLQSMLGDEFVVLTQEQQHELYFKTVQTERLMTITILSFILLIGTFTMVGSLFLLIYDKRRDIAILQSMGATLRQIRTLFFFEGLMVSFLGGSIGLLVGSGITWLQQRFGLLRLGNEGEGFIVNAYPVQIQSQDFITVFIIVMIIAVIASLLPILKIKPNANPNRNMYDKLPQRQD